MNKIRINSVFIFAAVLIAVLSGFVQAGTFKGALGILTPEVMDGDNPATGKPWRSGDTYRFAFHTSIKRTAEDTDISVYNDWVQGLANASTAYNIGENEGVTWKVIGSTDEVDARDNTSTNPEDANDLNSPIYLLDGSTLIASDNADLWDGEVQHIIDITEQGNVWAHWPFTGSYKDGTKAPGHGQSFSALGGTGNVHQGCASVTTQWVWRGWTGDPPETELPMYALSDPITVVIGDANLPSVDIVTPDTIAWSGEPVALDADVINNDTTVPQGDLTYSWTAEPNSVSDPNLTVTIIDADKEDAMVTITKAPLTGDATVVTLTLSVLLEGKVYAMTDSMTIDVYDNACQAAIQIGQAAFDPADFNTDCITNIEDIALMVTEWLVDYSILAPVEK